VIKEPAEEITGCDAESALKEGGKHYNFICIGCRKIFACCRKPLQHGAVREKVVRNKFVNLTFICDHDTSVSCNNLFTMATCEHANSASSPTHLKLIGGGGKPGEPGK
jgi:hypothetical protein